MLTIRTAQFSILEQEICRQLASAVLTELRKSAPHVVDGLSPDDLDERMDMATSKAASHQFRNRDNFMAFVRLSLVVGPFFDEYPPFDAIFAKHEGDSRIPALFLEALNDDWHRAAQFDIVRRYRKTEEMRGGISMEALGEDHAEAYFRGALHPDVWRLGRMKPMNSVAEVRQWIRALEPVAQTGYAIFSPERQFLGAAFVFEEETTTRASYWITRSAWGQGIATQALMYLREIARDKKLMLSIEPGNVPSRRVAMKCGFRQSDAFTFVT